jgi:hypothetical protein
MVLGTFKLGADLLNTKNLNGKFRDINKIFKRHALTLTVMIYKGCFELDCRKKRIDSVEGESYGF